MGRILLVCFVSCFLAAGITTTTESFQSAPIVFAHRRRSVNSAVSVHDAPAQPAEEDVALGADVLPGIDPSISEEDFLKLIQEEMDSINAILEKALGPDALKPQDEAETAMKDEDDEDEKGPVTKSAESQMNKERETIYRRLIDRSASSLKDELKKLGLSQKGRKPDLARRLAEYEVRQVYYDVQEEDMDEQEEMEHDDSWMENGPQNGGEPVERFAGLRLSSVAATSLGKAGFRVPSPIQAVSIPHLYRGESAILHAETGSGKTLAYLLPITERLWQEYEEEDGDTFENGELGVILTPTRELASQVAGVAQALAPPGTVRLIFQPTNLMKKSPREKGLTDSGSMEEDGFRYEPRLFVGSAKSIMLSLFGTKDKPTAPTTKPDAADFLRSIRWLVLDEVDRILHIKKSRGEKRFKTHEKPAAVITSAAARFTVGRVQVIAASATVGRPLRREVSRVLGVPTTVCPPVLRGSKTMAEATEAANEKEREKESRAARAIRRYEKQYKLSGSNTNRAVTIPSTVDNYYLSVNGTSVGNLLTSSLYVLRSFADKPRKILLVLTRSCGMSTKHAVGALKFFQCKPMPQSLLDALEADGTDRMIEKHREVSGATGIGETNYFEGPSIMRAREYLLVTGEDTIRGLHLDGLDAVVVIGKPFGPDEYTHIAGRTGRAGKSGKVVMVMSNDTVPVLKSWETMLNVGFQEFTPEKVQAMP